MFPKPALNRFFLILLSLLVIVSCKKSLLPNLTPPPPPGGGTDTAEITAIGTPNGNPVTKTIGTSGGSVLSADGKFTVTIPAGALNKNLDVTIQPITNEAPGGIGGGYELMPSGTIFNVPVTLSYHYTDDDMNGSNPYFVYIATQDSIGEWTEDILNRDLDTVGKIISVTTPHFSSYVLASSVHFEFGQNQFTESESNYIRVVQTWTMRDLTDISKADDDYLPFLTIHKKQQTPDAQVGHWSINDMGPTTADFGTITGSGAKVTYNAPADIEEEQTVKISAEVTGSYAAFVKGKKISLDKIIVLGEIRLVPDKFTYDVDIEYHLTKTNPCFIDNYTDGATLRVDIAKDVVTVSDIQNQRPNTVPTSGPATDGSGDACAFVLGNDMGMVNIDSGTGTVTPEGDAGPGVIKSATVTLNSSATGLPNWTVTTPDGQTSQYGAVPLPGFPPEIRIVLRDSTQVLSISSPPNTAGVTASATITITPVH
jgi:hypothetical protein